MSSVHFFCVPDTLLWEHGVLSLKLFAGFVLFSLVYVDFQMGNTVATFSS